MNEYKARQIAAETQGDIYLVGLLLTTLHLDGSWFPYLAAGGLGLLYILQQRLAWMFSKLSAKTQEDQA
jgi:hypothetical protein